MKEVLIAGGSGLIGTRLKEILLQKGYKVSILSRKGKNPDSDMVKYFRWAPEKQEIPKEALQSARYIINLAGAGIASKRWTKSYKDKILKSRIDSTATIVKALNENLAPEADAFLNGSAIGYYGSERGEVLTETSSAGSDFVAKVCIEWEREALKLKPGKIRLILPRTGIVLSTREGALKPMIRTIKYFIGTPLGSGRQFISWIHIDDLCHLFIWLLENEKTGIYNAVSPQPVTNSTLTKVIAAELHRPLILPPVPAFALKFLLGEMAGSVLGSAKVSSQKAMNSGFGFEYPEAGHAIRDLLSTGK